MTENLGRKALRDRGNDSSPIARARIAAGMTQGELAEKVGCLSREVSRWERGGRTPRIDTLKKIAAALGCAMDDLI